MGATVLDQLRTAVGGHAEAGGPNDQVGGVVPRFVARPGSTDETSALLRVAHTHGLATVARGSGTKLGWGTPPGRTDLLLDTGRMDAVVEHAAGDLIVVTGAGTRLDTLRDLLSGSGQRLGIDPARRGTVGGAVASAATGPTRLLHGAVRDLVIGLRLVRADGVVAHSGGKVVKNVAGYDLGKLLTGSLGTLGVITEVAFRLHPLPEAREWVTAPVGSPEQAQRLAQALVHSQLAPSAIELDLPDATSGTITVLLEGIAAGVAARSAQAAALLGGSAEIRDAAPDWWGAEPPSPSGVLIKATHEIGRLDALLQATAATAAAAGVTAALRGSPGVGTAMIGLSGGLDDETLAGLVSRLRAVAASFGGSVVLLEAPHELAHGIDRWGPVGGLGLMRAVKEQFDPGRLLAPGRFVGGI